MTPGGVAATDSVRRRARPNSRWSRIPTGHFVELVQPDQLPESPAPPTSNVVQVRVRVTVQDAEKAARLYRDVLGMHESRPMGAFQQGAPT